MSRTERYLIGGLLLTIVGLELRIARQQPVSKPFAEVAADAMAASQRDAEAKRVAYHELMQQKIADLNHAAEMRAIEQVRQEVDNAATHHE